MKQTSLIVATVLFIGASLLLCVAFMPVPLPEALIIEPREKHLGLQKRAVVSSDFKVTNGLPYSVELVSLIRSCGCTTATLDKSQLAPHEFATLKMAIDLGGKSGDFGTNVKVLYRRLGDKSDKLHTEVCGVFARTESVVQVSPSLLSFDSHSPSSQNLKYVLSTRECTVTGVFTTNKAFEALLSPDSTQVTVSFDPIRYREHTATPTLIIKTTCSEDEEIKIPLLLK